MKKSFKKFIYALAPMAGITDPIYTEIMEHLGADMTTTEMISTKALQYASSVTKKMITIKKSKILKCVQLFGHELPAYLEALKLDEIKNFDIIDINCGCPAPKIVKNKDGCAMMSNLDNTKKIIEGIVKNTTKPVSVKFRLGINGKNNYLEFAKSMEEAGASFLILHARTREQQYSGRVDIDAYKKLTQTVKIPVIFSGDIRTINDVSIAKSCNVAGVMIGRGVLSDPFIFFKLKGIDYLNNKKIYKNLRKFLNIDKNFKFFSLNNENKEIFLKQNILKYYFNQLLNYFSKEEFAVNYFKKHFAYFVSGMQNVTDLRLKIFSVKTKDEMFDLINSLCNNQE